MSKITRIVSRIIVSVGLSAGLLGASIAQGVPLSALPDLSALTPYTVFGDGIFLNLATVNGDVGISPAGTLKMSAPSFINGRLDRGVGSTASIDNPGHISAGINTGVDLSAAEAEVLSASNTLKNLAPDYTFGDVTRAHTFAAVGPVTVVDLNSLTLGGSNNITFTGGPNDVFVLNIAHGLALTGSSIIGAGGIDPSHILINLYDNSGNLGTAAHIGNVLNGSVLIPFDTATFHSMNGATWSATNEITFMSGATIQGVPFVPEAPTTSLLAFGGLLALGLVLRRRSKAQT
jgi:hypothetical protein